MTVQGDGIHVLELSNMHASASHTLGPSAFFSAPAVTRFESFGARTTYAVMQSASDGVDAKGRGRTVWRWRSQQPGRPEEPATPKLSAVFPQLIERLWVPLALPSHAIAVSPSGQIMLADEELNVIAGSTAPDGDIILFKSWLFEPKECTFLPHVGDNSSGMAALCFILDGKRLKLRITLVQQTEHLKELVECDLGSYENVTDISCDPSGYTSVLTQTGEWKIFRLIRDGAGAVTVTPLAESLHLAGLTGISSESSSSSGSHGINGPRLLSVGTSYVLLASLVNGLSPEITLLLWDLQHSVVLASQTISMPSTATFTPLPSLELVPASGTQALLVISPAAQTSSHHKQSAAQSRSTVFVVPLDVPSVSTIALAMGKARDTERWLKNIHTPSTVVEQDVTRSSMLESVRNAMEKGQPQDAEAAFFGWIDEETARLKREQAKKRLWANNGPKPTDNPAHSKKMGKNTSSKPALSYHFVSSLLNALLVSSKHSESTYSSKIVLYLVDRKAVGNVMVEGGVVPALRDRQDWESIYSAMRNISDLPETDLITLLAEVVMSHRRQRESEKNGMEVDAPADVPRLAQFLAPLVGYTTTPPALRLALKHHLTDVRDIVCVLEVLEGWVARWCSKSLELPMDTGSSTVDANQPARRKVRPALNQGLPRFENVMSFLQSVLDAHFPSMLQYSASYEIMDRLSQYFNQLLTSFDEIDCLRGPLESFIHAKAVAEKEGRPDSRKKRREAVRSAELAIGLYQLEELFL